MPKSRQRKRPARTAASGGGQIQWGQAGTAKKSGLKGRLILIAIAAVIVIGGGAYVWQSISFDREFENLAKGGEAVLSRVASTNNLGRSHLALGEDYSYRSAFPVSGPHNRSPVQPGFYDEPQLPTRLVHALEHGHVVIYYGAPGNEALDSLKSWAGHYTGRWDGVVVVPNRSLARRLVLTAWRRRLTLGKFDAKAAAVFIDTFRGRGPENRVR